MPAKDNVDLRQCVDLLTQMLEKDAGAAQHSTGRRSRAKSGVPRRSTVGAGRSVGHQTARKCGTTVPKVRNGLRGSGSGKLARTVCTARSRPIAGLTPVVEEYDESSEATDQDVRKRVSPERSSKPTSTKKLYPTKASPQLHYDCPDTSSVSHNPVLFNQRLLSSTPLDTPVKRTLVERNGTIFLNGSTDTMILNATDEAMALHPPGPPATGPSLYSGLINFAPNPAAVQFQCPVTAGVAATIYPKFDPSTPAVVQLSSAGNVCCAADNYSLYSSSLSSKTGTTVSSSGDSSASRGLNGHLSYPAVQSSTPADTFGTSRSHNSIRPPYNSPESHFTVNSSSSPFTVPCAAPAVQQYLKQTSTASGYKTACTGTLTSVARGAAGTHLSSGDRLSRAGNARVPTGGRHRLSKSPHVYRAPTSVDVATTAAPPFQHSSKDSRTATDGAPLVGSGTSPVADSVGCSRPNTTTAAQLVPLLEQLREVVVANRESELVRLINEICDAARTSRHVAETDRASTAKIPAKAATNIDVELALQPLRSENAELRRQLRITRQQLREKDELVTAMQKPDESFQVLHLTMLNKHLEKQLEECRNEVENLRRRLEVLVEGCDQMMREKVAVVNLMAKKEEDHMNALQQRSAAVHQIQMELETARAEKLQTEQKMMQLNSDCQQAVLKLQQKDVEYQRARELIRSLHEMMSQLVRDLQSSRPNAMNASTESTRLNDTINAISERLSHLSFITPAVLYDPGQLSRSAKRSLNFDSLHAAGSCNVALSPLSPNHLLPSSDAFRFQQQQQQSYVAAESPVTPLVIATRNQGSLSGSKPLSSGPTTVQALLTPIAERMQRKPRTASQWTDSDAGPAPRTSSDLDRTLTEDQIPTDNGGTSLTYSDTEPRILNSTTLPEDSSDQSRWSATDYFRKYPPTATVHSETIGSESSALLCSRLTHDSLQRWNDETRPKRRMSRDDNDDDASAPLRVLSPSMDVEFSTLLSNSLIRPNNNHNDSVVASGGDLRHLSSVYDADSTGTAASLDSVSTEDDLAFRAGLAQLDANIARIQQQLHGTLTSSPARNLGRSFSSV